MTWLRRLLKYVFYATMAIIICIGIFKIYINKTDSEKNFYPEYGWKNNLKKEITNNFQSNCIFCKIGQSKKIAFANFKYCFAIKDKNPVSLGHVLIIPYRHFENWFEADLETQFDIIKAINEIKKMLDTQYHPDGYNIGINCGVPAGQSIMHLHVHLIPRYKNDVENPRDGIRGLIHSKQNYT